MYSKTSWIKKFHDPTFLTNGIFGQCNLIKMDLLATGCFVESKKVNNGFSHKARLFIRGTPFFLDIEGVEKGSFKFQWSKKRKRSYDSYYVSFDDILGSTLISIKAKETIIFNINLFA